MTLPLDVTDPEIIDACNVAAGGTVNDAGLVCRNVYRWTENSGLAGAADWLLAKPARILVIFFVAFVVNRIVRRAILHLVQRLSDDDALAAKRRLREMAPQALRSTGDSTPLRAQSRAQTIGLVLKSAASVSIYSLAALTALAEIGINLAPLIAGAGIVGVALGFGAQSLVKDFLSGLFILAEDQYGVGDVIDVGELTGTVELVNLRTTKLRSVDGTVWYVPNGEIQRVGNMSQQWARALLDIDVAYDTDLNRATDIVKEVADGLLGDEVFGELVLEEPEVWGIQSLGADGVSIRLVVKTKPGEQWGVSRQLRRRIKDRFDAEGIEIPFPQRVVWVRRDEGASVAVDGELGLD